MVEVHILSYANFAAFEICYMYDKWDPKKQT